MGAHFDEWIGCFPLYLIHFKTTGCQRCFLKHTWCPFEDSKYKLMTVPSCNSYQHLLYVHEFSDDIDDDRNSTKNFNNFINPSRTLPRTSRIHWKVMFFVFSSLVLRHPKRGVTASLPRSSTPRGGKLCSSWEAIWGDDKLLVNYQRQSPCQSLTPAMHFSDSAQTICATIGGFVPK